MKAGIVLSQDATSSGPQSIHQRSSICWDDFKATFLDEPVECQEVCDSCHTYATVVPDSSGNPQAFTTDVIFPEAPVDDVNWDTIGLLQQSCRECHSDEIDTDTDTGTGTGTNHPVLVEHSVSSSDNFKETELKLFDGKILCTTCHSPHSENVALLRIPNQGSALCIDCHTN